MNARREAGHSSRTEENLFARLVGLATFVWRSTLRIVAAEVRPVGTITAAAVTTPAPIAAAVAVLVAVALALALIVTVAAEILLRLLIATRDESGEATRVLTGIGLMLRTMLRVIAWRKWLRIARRIRLLLLWRLNEAGFVLAHERLTVIAIVIEVFAAAALRLLSGLTLLRLLLLVIRVLLAELFLRGSDQAEIMFGVLIVVFRRYRVARALRVARELNVFLRDVRRRTADLHIRPVRFVDPRQRILAFAVTTASPHALLTVSHDTPVR